MVSTNKADMSSSRFRRLRRFTCLKHINISWLAPKKTSGKPVHGCSWTFMD